MVKLSQLYLAAKQIRNRTFLDKVRVYVRGGGGGQGHPQYGGQGGRGGHIYVTGQEGMTLKQLVSTHPTKRFIGSSGTNSKRHALLGAPGSNVHIPVPAGIIVRNDVGRVLGEINEPGDEILVAKGGVGGGPTNRYLGKKGHTLSVTLDLKLIADIGFVGFPNAGKSTLLSAISRAAPKIASYPFTTIQPQLGTMEYEDQRKISAADLPGLIEGAHINVGMGHSFLKHVERTKILLFVVDVNGFRLGPKHPLRSPLETVLLLNRELELYREELLSTPAILALNKVDTAQEIDTAELVAQCRDLRGSLKHVNEDLHPDTVIKFDEIMLISAKMRTNTDHLKDRLRAHLDFMADQELLQSQSGETRLSVGQTLSEETRGSHLV